ncbi:MAG: hypothetical protein IPJ38_19740 [Dechloromonas sp.]|uniref:Uncharacterized protein n=1 Tax=Candidatus Dechloromonas phosphorivorans TaxID=2899244 RepID=A0A935K7K4_9RHOO|nr:hypothetical protein [Candidatus Dechloromonas phosphorivorans]
MRLTVDLQLDLAGLLFELGQRLHGGDHVAIVGQPLRAKPVATRQRQLLHLQAGFNVA